MRDVAFSQNALSCLGVRGADEEGRAGFSTLRFLECVLERPTCNANKALQAIGLRTQALLETLNRFSQRPLGMEAAAPGTLERARELAEAEHRRVVGTDHLLLAVMAQQESRAGFLLHQLGLGVDEIRESLRQLPEEP